MWWGNQHDFRDGTKKSNYYTCYNYREKFLAISKLRKFTTKIVRQTMDLTSVHLVLIFNISPSPNQNI